MKQGKSITELAMELERQTQAKRDFVSNTKNIEMIEGNKLAIETDSKIEVFDVNSNCHGQLSSRLKIPKPYYDKMLVETPDLLQTNVNRWLGQNPENRLVRTLDGTSRAFLSDRYRTLDNIDLMANVLPILVGELKTEFLSCEVTENRMYVKVLFPELESEVNGSTLKGDIVKAGLVISNSEVGNGSLRVEPLIYRLVCLNGMISNTSMKKYHIGKSQGTFEQAYELFQDETKRITDKAFWLQIQDVIRGSVNRDIFQSQVDRLSESTGQKIEGNVSKAIEVVAKSFQLSENQSSEILKNLIIDSDISKWGVANAVTKLANVTEDYEMATRLEAIGGKIIDLSNKEWAVISKAA